MSEKTRILNMLKDGSISVEEAEALLNALETPKSKSMDAPAAFRGRLGRKPRKLRIKVDAVEMGSEKKAEKVKANVTVPLGLLKTLGPLVKKSVPSDVQNNLNAQGIDLDEILKSVTSLTEEGLDEDILDVVVDGENGELVKVRIYVD